MKVQKLLIAALVLIQGASLYAACENKKVRLTSPRPGDKQQLNDAYTKWWEYPSYHVGYACDDNPRTRCSPGHEDVMKTTYEKNALGEAVALSSVVQHANAIIAKPLHQVRCPDVP